MIRQGVRAAVPVAIALCLGGCEAGQTATPVTLPAPPPPLPPPPPAPRLTGEPVPLRLVQGGEAVQVRVSELFVVADEQQAEVEVEARSADESVATLQVQGTGLSAMLVITAVTAGSTSVAVTLRTSVGSATQAIPVQVAPPPPMPVEEPQRIVTLVEQGPGEQLAVAEMFVVHPAHADRLDVEIHSSNENVATASLHGTGLGAVATVEPVTTGFTWILIHVHSPAGTATKQIGVEVLSVPTEPPRLVEEPEPIRLVAGGGWRLVRLYRFLTTGDEEQNRATAVEVQPADPDVVTVLVEGRFEGRPGLVGEMLVGPASAGETTIVVRARNAAGVAVARFPVTVVSARPPEVVGRVGPVRLVAGAGRWERPLAGLFDPPKSLLEARSLDETVVRAQANSQDSGFIELSPLGVGETAVVVTARNSAGAAELTIRVTVLEKVPIGLTGLSGTAGGPPAVISEGSEWSMEIRSLEPEVHGIYWDHPVTFEIAADAPPGELEYPGSVAAGGLHLSYETTAFSIRAPADDVPGEPERTYELSIVSAEGLPAWMELLDEPLRVTVVDSPVAHCRDLLVYASLERASGGARRANVTIRAPHPDTSVSWVAPYIWRGNSSAGPTMTHLFPERLPFREVGDGFDQEVRLIWWDGDLRLTVEAPGCDAVELRCDESICTVR